MKAVKTMSGEELMISLVSKEDQQLLGREPVTLSDLHLARDETWLRGLRAGTLGEDLSGLGLQIWPGENRGAEQLEGYTIELQDSGRSFRRNFPVASLSAVAQRGALRLLQNDNADFKAKDTFAYYLTALPGESAGETAARDIAPPARHRLVAPVFEPGPLADFMQNSEPFLGNWASAEEEDQFLPAFVSREVWQEGEELARRGGERESAAVWTGRLFRDTRSAEIFVHLDACLEAEHAQEEKFAVTFSGDTWARVRELLSIRRQRLNRPHERILGSVHGHNFMPEANEQGRRMCDICALSKLCSRTTAAASLADLEWHRSVFTAQPWALLLVWGFNAREETDWRLYGLSGGTLAPRGLRLLTSGGNHGIKTT